MAWLRPVLRVSVSLPDAIDVLPLRAVCLAELAAPRLEQVCRSSADRLGVPFVIGVYLVMPVAFYPVYRLTAADPDWPAFWSQWNALPITPGGPMWFLWFLIALNIGAALLYRL